MLGIDLGSWPFIVFGAVIWFGVWRSWAYGSSPLPRQSMLGAPWLAAMFATFKASSVAESLGVAVPSDALVAVLLLLGAVGMGALLVQWPPWALPPWYRALEDEEVRQSRANAQAGAPEAEERGEAGAPK